MSLPLEPAIHALAVAALQSAIRRKAVRLLEAPQTQGVTPLRLVERLMRIAIALAGAGSHFPTVQVHNLPPATESSELPEVVSFNLPDLLAARAADSLPAALQGDPEALSVLEREAERIIETEDIELS
jgi:hypothetical protein